MARRRGGAAAATLLFFLSALAGAVIAEEALHTAYAERIAVLGEKYGDYGKGLFALHDGVPEHGDAAPSWLSDTALHHLVRALRSCRQSQTPFVMAVGGHSAAAAHGNLLTESYAAVAGAFLQPLFAAAGMTVEVRARAMGGQRSSPTSYCMGCIFGDDAHAVTWDYGMTDGRDTQLLQFYAKQALLLPQRPAVLLMQHANSRPTSRMDIIKAYAQEGWPVGAVGTSLFSLEKTLPPKDADEASLPEWIQGLQDPNKLGAKARSDKYSEAAHAACRGQILPGAAAWHPGYREHRLAGHMLAIPILTAFKEAFLTELQVPPDATLPVAPSSALCAMDDCRTTFACRSCLYPRHAALGKNDWDLGSLVVSAETAELQRAFGAGASTTWQKDCKFTAGPDPEDQLRPEANCLGHRDGQGAIFETLSEAKPEFLLFRLPVAWEAVGGPRRMVFSVVVCEVLCDWGRCEPTRAPVENATLSFDGTPSEARPALGLCREVHRDIQPDEGAVFFGIRNPGAGKTVKLNSIAWGLRLES